MKKNLPRSIFAMLLVSSCQSYPELKEAENPNIATTTYQETLRKGYISLHKEGLHINDKAGAKYFAKKAASVAKGRPTPADAPVSKKLSAAKIKELDEAYIKLISLQAGNLIKDYPINMANSQLNFDCWLQRAGEYWVNEKYVNQCKNNFYDNIDQLLKIKESRSLEQDEIQEPQTNKIVENKIIIEYPKNDENKEEKPSVEENCKPCKKTDISKLRTTKLYFDLNQYSLDDDSKEKITNLYQVIKDTDPVLTILEGYADSTGNPSYNDELSKRRVMTVKNYLIELGLPQNDIITYFYGSRNYMVKSNGNPEKENRVVIIRFKPKGEKNETR